MLNIIFMKRLILFHVICNLKNANDANDALKDVFGPLFEKLLNAEMDAHLGYDKNSQDPKETEEKDSERKQFKALLVKQKYQYQETEMVHLNQSLFQSEGKMFQK